MRSALYYPHTEVSSKNLVKTALLLWDKLEYIVPWADYRAHYHDPLIARAMELVGQAHVPNKAEMTETHAHVVELIGRVLPPQFFLSEEMQWLHRYELYPEKLLPETWRLLLKSRLAGPLLPDRDYPMTEPAGLTIMSILADCCAGGTRSRVTDRGAAYATLAEIVGSNTREARKKEHRQEQLVPITLDTVDMHSITLEKLIEFREREERQSGYTIRELRHRYADTLEKYVSRLTTEVVAESDVAEIKRQFADEMMVDLKKLKEELFSAGLEVVLSKEMLVTALTGVGTIASWVFGVPLQIGEAMTVAGAPVTIGGLFGGLSR
jgi:hypothetical protein